MYELIASELFNKPHLVSADRLDALASYVLSRKGFDFQVPDQPKPMAFAASDTAVRSDNGYYIDGGVAIIDMIGTMVHRAGFMQAMSGIIGYADLSRRFHRAINDPEVKAILLHADTPGGGVSGAFDFSDLVYEARGVKPVYTLAADCLCSAGILIGSSAEKVFTTQTGQLGSIGVVMKHMDISKWNSKTGIKNTYIYAGDRKIDGNPDQPLSKEIKALFQAEVQQLYSMFVSVVQRNTDLTEQEIIDTQAAVYLGEDAVEVGLSEAVTTGDQLLEDMKTEHGTGRPYLSSTTTLETQAMSNEKDDKPKASAGNKDGEDQAAAQVETEVLADPDKSVVTDKPAASSAKEEPVEVSETEAANQRFETIMGSDAANGREKAAVRLATKTTMSAKDVIATLEELPVDAKAPSKLDAAMQAAGSPGVGAEADNNAEANEEQATVNAIAGGILKNMK